MDCWDVLGIERFSDKKTIKIAYAKQLKLHRPDDDPEGFQQLHRAYKSALSWVPETRDEHSIWMNLDETPLPEDASTRTEVVLKSSEYPLEETAEAIKSDEALNREVTVAPLAMIDSADHDGSIASLTPEISEADRQLLDEIQRQEYLLRDDWQTLSTTINDMLTSANKCNDLTAWEFIESLSSMSDLAFRKAASDHVFERVAEANEVSLQNKHLHIKRPVLYYLNQQFLWDKRWQEYEGLHSKSMLNAVYPYLENDEKPIKGITKKREFYFYRRAAAFAIDLLLLFVPLIFYSLLKGLLSGMGFKGWLEGIDTSEVIIVWTCVYLYLLIPLQECSRHQATLGKRLLNLHVINKQGDRIGFIQAFWRGLVTILCCAGFKIVLFINLALSYWRAEILQDTLSQSYVVMRPSPPK